LKKILSPLNLILLIILIILLLSIPKRKNAAPNDLVERVTQLPVQLYAAVPQAAIPVAQENPAGAVFTGSVEMTSWVVCVDEARVYSNPGANVDWHLYSLPRDTAVTVRELDHTRTWAAIKVANYVRFTDLCWAEDRK
jgi:hypothetical protein